MKSKNTTNNLLSRRKHKRPKPTLYFFYSTNRINNKFISLINTLGDFEVRETSVFSETVLYLQHELDFVFKKIKSLGYDNFEFRYTESIKVQPIDFSLQ